MTASYIQEIFTVGDFARMKSTSELEIQPKFQRRSLWTPDARSYLIDTIVRGLPMPKIYLRRCAPDPDMPPVFEVVDGQQRLRSIFHYLSNDFVLKQKHNRDFPNLHFDELPDPLQRSILGYSIAVEDYV